MATKRGGKHYTRNSTTKEFSIVGGKYEAESLRLDALREPFVVCDVDKRRKCDSYYVSVNRELQKRIDKAVIEISSLMSQYFYNKNFVIEDTHLDKILSILEPTSDRSKYTPKSHEKVTKEDV